MTRFTDFLCLLGRQSEEKTMLPIPSGCERAVVDFAEGVDNFGKRFYGHDRWDSRVDMTSVALVTLLRMWQREHAEVLKLREEKWR